MTRRFVALGLLMATVACRPGGESGAPLVVFAASSLTDMLPVLGDAYRAETGRDVTFVFAGSQVLRLQLEQGARADVFLSADAEHAEALADAGLASVPVPFARSELVAAVPDGGALTWAEVLASERVVIGTAAVPVGAYTRLAWGRLPEVERRQLEAAVVSEESNVRLARSRLMLGEADAAFVYASDVSGVAGLRRVELPDEAQVAAVWVGTILTDAAQPDAAAAFLAHLRSPDARGVLEAHGFEAGSP